MRKGRGKKSENERKGRGKKTNIDQEACGISAMLQRCNAIAISASETAIRKQGLLRVQERGQQREREREREGEGGNTLEFFPL